MGVSDERKVAKPHLPPLSHGLPKAQELSVSPGIDGSADTDAIAQNGGDMSIVHLPPGDTRLASCITVNHALHTVDQSVGVATFHTEKSYGGVTTVKAIRNNYKDSCKFLRFLASDLLAHQRSGSLNVDIKNCGLCWYDPERYQDGSYNGPATLFRKVTFCHDGQINMPECVATEDTHALPLQSEHLIHFRCGALREYHRFSTYATSPITIVSGVCLFSAAILDNVRNFDNDNMQHHGRRVRDIVEHPTLHATEAICRLSQNIADMVCMLKYTTSTLAKADPAMNVSSDPISVKLDVARLAYYDVAREMLSAKKWDWESGRLWLDMVDRRHDMLFDDFSLVIEAALRERGLDPRVVRIYASSGTRVAEQAFKSKILEGQLPDVGICLHNLGHDTSNLWSDFLDLAQVSQEQKKVLTIKDLARLTYIYELIEPVLNRERSVRRRLAIMVDCPFEWRIFGAASKALDRYNKIQGDAKHLLIGAFPFPRILTTPCKSLYYYDCRRQYREKADVQNITRFDEATPRSKIYLNTSDLADLSARLSMRCISHHTAVCEEPTS